MNSELNELFARSYKVLSDRTNWEAKQRRWYLMRHDGLRRRNKPFPTAADLHLALIDESVKRLKAFTLAQISGTPRLATFMALRQQLLATTEAAADFFSFELKWRSNLLKVLETTVDTMWLRGRGIIKAYVDPFDEYKLTHENVDPLFLLMTEDYNGFEDAARWTHVRQMNVDKFKLDRRYCNGNVDTQSLNLMRGGKDALERLKSQRGKDFDESQADKEIREGYTHSSNTDTIIIWETYVRTLGGVTVYTYCPVAMDVEVRKPFGVPYKTGGKVSQPFYSFQSEVKDEGWYAPRGLGEILADYEIFGSKVWNAQADLTSFAATPMLTGANPIQNPANYRMAPFEYIPGDVKPIQMGSDRSGLTEQIQFARSEAQQRSASPDFGTEDNLHAGEKPTAKQVGYVEQLQQVGTSHTNSIFSRDLGELLKHDWGLCLQYKRKNLTYFMVEDLQTLPEQALHDEYLITVGDGSGEWDKKQRLAKAVQRLQTFKGAPNVNQDELVKSVLEADDARLVKRMLMPGKQRESQEAFAQAEDIATMMVTHFPAPVLPDQDQIVRIKSTLDFLHAGREKGQMPDPTALKLIQDQVGARLEMLKQMNPQGHKQAVQMIEQAMQQDMQAQKQPRQLTASPQPATLAA